MNECNIKGSETIWPEEGDDSGDTMFMLDNNSLIRQLRGAKNKVKRDLFLSGLDDLEMEEDPEEEMEEDPEEEMEEGVTRMKYEDLDKKNKIAFILRELEKYKSNDL